MISDNICPVCETNPIAAPHKVCRICYNKVKAYYVQPREHFEREQEKFRLEWLKDGKNLPPETIEHNITFCMKNEAGRWERIVGNGLSAVFVMIEAVDDRDAATAFHRRRITFMRDLIDRLDPALFEPAAKEQVDIFVQAAVDFWNGKISEDERGRIQREFDLIMPKADPTDWDAKSIVHWMIGLEDYLGWMWYQWFESVYDAIPDELPDDVWIELFKKHFADIITEWVLTT